ncbi:MAG: tRNA (guanosine(37)-N1)-methyltransferase TrmD [Gammaproteobacteria bacterium]
MHINVISLFPDMIREAAAYGVCGRAIERQLVDLVCTNPRDFTEDSYQTVDDRPYGGGPGMVLKYEPLSRAIEDARSMMPEGSRVVFLNPQGRVFDQNVAVEMSELPGLIFIAGRYEGFDERLIDRYADDEVSLGDYVLSGGEAAALVLMDAVIRLLPGVLGSPDSIQSESFMDGLLDYPQYTRPESIDGQGVPAVLQEGNHAAIRRWRLKQALGRTWLRRPDLLNGRKLSDEEQMLLDEFRADHGDGSSDEQSG